MKNKPYVVTFLCRSFDEFMLMQVIGVYSQSYLRSGKRKNCKIEIREKKRIFLDGKKLYPK